VSYGATSCPANAAHVAYPNSGAYAGVWADTTNGAAPGSATSGQLGAEAVAAAAHFGNTTANANRNAQYVVVSPTGTHPDGFNAGAGFCAWHSYVYSGNGGSPYGTLMFTNMPYVTDMGYSCGGNFVNGGGAGTLDGVTIVEGHEYSETVTDPTLGAWYDGNGWENADRCAWLGGGGTGGVQNYTFSTGTFAVQGSWSNDTADCRVAHAIFNVAPSNFGMTATVPAAVRQGGSTTATINTTVASGSSLAVTLAAVNAPAGITPSFNANPVTSGNPATLTLNVGANVAPGRYTVKVNGTANNGISNLLHSVNVSVTVTPANDFSLTGGTVTGRQGASAAFTQLTNTAVGNPMAITLATSHVPAGVTPSFNTNPVTSGGSTTLTLAIAANAMSGRYPITVTGSGTSGGATVTHTETVTLTIGVGNDFSLVGGGVSGAQGASPTFSLATHTSVGSPQSITFSTSHVPAGVTPSFVANPVTSDGTAGLQLAIAANVVPGRYSMTVTGRAAAVVR
jgi:serine protease